MVLGMRQNYDLLLGNAALLLCASVSLVSFVIPCIGFWFFVCVSFWVVGFLLEGRGYFPVTIFTKPSGGYQNHSP